MHWKHLPWLAMLAIPLVEPADQAARYLARADGSRIHYYLEQRDEARPARQLLVIVQGSDCNSVTRVAAIHRYMVRVMPAADVLTVEKYGLDASLAFDDDPDRADCPPAYLRNDSPRQREQDLAAVIAELRGSHAYRQVIALGGSEGALVVHRLAAQPGRVDAGITFNGGGQWFLDDLLHSVTTSSPAATEQAQRGIREFIRQLQAVPPAERDGLNISGHGYRWWRDSLATDQLALLRRSTVPMLIIQSGADRSVSPRSAQSMLGQLRRAGKDNIDYRRYPSLDHRLNGPDGRSEMPAVVAGMTAWLRDLDLTARAAAATVDDPPGE